MRLIDADALLEKMSYHCDICQYHSHKHPCRRECDWREAMDDVDDMDEIEIEQPQPGMWVYCEDGDGQDGYKCTKCGFFEPWYYKYEGINFIHSYKRCPGCGSVMTEMSCGEVGE